MNPNDSNDWKALLRAAHNEPIDAAHYTAVRARVLAEIERTRSPWRRLAWLAWLSGVAAIAAALVFAIVLRQPDDGAATVRERRPLAIAIPPAPPASVLTPRPAQVAHAKAPRRPHREPLTIKLQTSDPNIVIYWIAD